MVACPCWQVYQSIFKTLSYKDTGKVTDAIGFYERALAIACEINDHQLESAVLTNLGLAHMILEKPSQARAYYERALAIDRETGDVHGEATVLFNLSLTLDQLGQHDQAIAYAQTALEIRTQIEDPRADRVRVQLGEWYQEKLV